MNKELLICPECNIPLALLGMLDKKTKKEQWVCAKCQNIYLGKKIRKRRLKDDNSKN